MKKIFCVTVLVFIAGIKLFSQNYFFDSTRVHAQGNPGDLFLSAFVITNNTSGPLTFHLNRIVKDLPSNWYSCFCYPTCIAPWIDTLTFTIPPIGSDSIKPNYGTDSVPGIGYITTVLLIQDGESFSPVDTIYFTGSTLSTSVNDIEETFGTIYPNPAEDFVEIIFPNFKAPFDVLIYNTLGKEVLKSRITSPHATFYIGALSPGVYFLRRDTNSSTLTFLKK